MTAAPAKPAQLNLSQSDQDWIAAMAKDIAIHSGTGSFLLLFADGEDLDVYVSTEP